MEITDKYACQIHGIISSDSDSDFENTKDLDEAYNSLKPPPFEYESIKDKIVVISRQETNKEQETSDMTLVTRKKKKKRKQANVNGNIIKPNQNKENIATVGKCCPKVSNGAASVSQAKKKSKQIYVNSSDHAQIQANKTSNSSQKKKKKLKNSALDSRLKCTEQSQSSKKKKKLKSGASENKLKNAQQNQSGNTSSIKKKTKKLKNNPQRPASVNNSTVSTKSSEANALNSHESGEICDSFANSRDVPGKLHEISNTLYSGLSPEQNIQLEMQKNFLFMEQEIQALGCQIGLLCKSDKSVERFYLDQMRKENFAGNCETEKNSPPTQKLKDENDSDVTQSTSNINGDNTETNTSLTGKGTKKKGKLKKKSKQGESDVNFCGEGKSNEGIVGSDLSFAPSQILNCFESISSQEGQNLEPIKRHDTDYACIAPENIAPKNEDVRRCDEEFSKQTKLEIQGLLTKETLEKVETVLLKQSQIDTLDLVSRDRTADPEKTIKGLMSGKNVVFQIEIQGNQVLKAIKKACQMYLTRTTVSRDNLSLSVTIQSSPKRSLLKRLKTYSFDPTDQKIDRDVKETIRHIIDEQILKTLIFAVYPNSSTIRDSSPLTFAVQTRRYNKTSLNKKTIYLKDFQRSLQHCRSILNYALGCDVLAKWIRYQNSEFYIINLNASWPEHKNMSTYNEQVTYVIDLNSRPSTIVQISGLKDQKNESFLTNPPNILNDNVNNARGGNVLRDNGEFDGSWEKNKPTEDSPNDQAEQKSVNPETETDSLRCRVFQVALIATLAYLAVSLFKTIALFLLYNIFFVFVILVLYFYL